MSQALCRHIGITPQLHKKLVMLDSTVWRVGLQLQVSAPEQLLRLQTRTSQPLWVAQVNIEYGWASKWASEGRVAK